MQLISHDLNRLVFHLSKDEVELVRYLIDFGLTVRRTPIRFSRNPQDLPSDAAEDFAAAMRKKQDAGRDFLRRVFHSDSGHLQESTSEAKGFGLTLSRPEMEQLLQALNDIKLAHWEALGFPAGDAASEADIPPERLPSMMIMDLINEIQMLLLRAISAAD